MASRRLSMSLGNGVGVGSVEGNSSGFQTGANGPVVKRPKRRQTENTVIWIQAPPFKRAGKRYGIRHRTWNAPSLGCQMIEFTLRNRKTVFTEIMSMVEFKSHKQGRKLMRLATRIVAEVLMVNGANDVCLMNVGYGRIGDMATPTATMLVAFSHVPISIRLAIIDLEEVKKACEAAKAQAAQRVVSDMSLMM